MMKLSNTQIDRLGDRLKQGPISDDDLILLDAYRKSCGEAYEIVLQNIREQLKLEPAGRPAKSTGAIMGKLRRGKIQLSQIQDIAGCRIVVSNVVEQERVVASLRSLFPEAQVVDRRVKPSYGYRAVHVIPKISGKRIEIQVRSQLQHIWALRSEKLSEIDPTIKYGGGIDEAREFLVTLSAYFEMLEKKVVECKEQNAQEQVMRDTLRRMITEIYEKICDELKYKKEQQQ